MKKYTKIKTKNKTKNSIKNSIIRIFLSTTPSEVMMMKQSSWLSNPAAFTIQACSQARLSFPAHTGTPGSEREKVIKPNYWYHLPCQLPRPRRVGVLGNGCELTHRRSQKRKTRPWWITSSVCFCFPHVPLRCSVCCTCPCKVFLAILDRL